MSACSPTLYVNGPGVVICTFDLSAGGAGTLAGTAPVARKPPCGSIHKSIVTCSGSTTCRTPVAAACLVVRLCRVSHLSRWRDRPSCQGRSLQSSAAGRCLVSKRTADVVKICERRIAQVPVRQFAILHWAHRFHHEVIVQTQCAAIVFDR